MLGEPCSSKCLRIGRGYVHWYLVALEESSFSPDSRAFSRGVFLEEQTSNAARGIAARTHLRPVGVDDAHATHGVLAFLVSQIFQVNQI